MNKRKYLIIFGVVITTLLMISSATAVKYSNDGALGEEITTPLGGDDEEEEEQPDEESYVDPSVELIANLHLTTLETLVNKLNDPKHITFTQELISELKKDGKVDAQDVKDILGRHESLLGSSVHTGLISGTSGGYSTAGGFPYRPHLIRPRGADQMRSWLGPGLAVWWDSTYILCSNNVDLTIGGFEVGWQHTGIAFFQVGYWQVLGWRHGCVLFQEYEFSITAISPLILISGG